MSSDYLEEPGETPEPGGAESETPAHRADSGWSWRLVGLGILAAILVVLVIIALGVYGADRNDRAKAADQTLAEFAEGVARACTEKPAEARAAGIQCTKAKEIDQRPPEEKADPVAKGLTEAQVRSVVVAEIGKSDLTVSPSEVNQIARTAAALVPKPKDGKSPSTAQVQGLMSATLQTFCAQDSKPCQGDDGPKGQAAPPITEAQLSAAVAAFCGADAVNCRGPRGEGGPAGRGIKSITKSGENVTVTYTDDTTATFTVANGTVGPAGPAGRGIESGPLCMGEGADTYWLTTYTDGTEQRQDVQCKVVPLLPPAPTAT